MYCQPAREREPVWVIASEKAILESYWEDWQTKMLIKNIMTKQPQDQDVTQDNCILDWAIIHWADEVPPEKVEALIYGKQ
jgi:hypothetical protein